MRLVNNDADLDVLIDFSNGSLCLFISNGNYVETEDVTLKATALAPFGQPAAKRPSILIIPFLTQALLIQSLALNLLISTKSATL